jgi:hypothetical protein
MTAGPGSAIVQVREHRMRIVLAAVAALALTGAARAAAPDWGPLAWLKGHWTGEGGGAQQGAGGFSFLPEAGGTVLVRRNTADYPAQNGRPASHHEDLMVIHRDGERLRADYWDSEGQTIHYVVTASEPGLVVFLSDPGPGPRFRLTYRQRPKGLEGRFEIAPPNAPEQFKDYLTWTARRAP